MLLTKGRCAALPCLIVAALTAMPAAAVNPAMWSFDVATEGEDIFWTSPTPVDLGFAAYQWDYEIIRADVTAAGITVGILDQIGDFTMGSGVVPALPLTLVDENLMEPTSGSTADIFIEVDENGFGQLEVTNIVLGQIVLIIFPIDIERVELEATITITGIDGPPGDYDNNGIVNDADLAVWQAGLGTTSGATKMDGDGDGDGDVDLEDAMLWQRHHGDTVFPPDPPPMIGAVPEPTTASLVFVALTVFGGCRRRLVESRLS